MPTNIVLVITDQQRTDTLGCYGAAWARTPRLDALAAEGAVFTRSYCCNPVCTPARASLFTGKRVGRHGVWNVGIDVPRDERLFSHRLRDAGYRTHYVGKAHFRTWLGTGSPERNDAATPPIAATTYYGFDSIEMSVGHATYGLLAGDYGAWLRAQATGADLERWSRAHCRSATPFGGAAFDWDLPLRLHSSVWTADRAVDFLRTRARERPFLLVLGFQDPHHPHCVPRELAERVDPATVPPPDFVAGELADKPPHFLAAHIGTIQESDARGAFPVAGQLPGHDVRAVSARDAREGRAYYHTLVSLIDAQVGRVLDALAATGAAEDTLVLFTTDHGELLGDHGLWMKGPFHYEPAIRVPLIVRGPGFAPGTRSAALVSHLDVAPTVLAAAGLAADPDHDGAPLTAPPAARDHVLVEHVDDPLRLRLKTIVTANRKLTWYAGRDEGELYDLAADPHERVNRWRDAAWDGERARLLRRLLDALERGEARQPRVAYV